MKRILIIGNGSIAQKHQWILKKYIKGNKIFIYSKHNNHKKKNIIKNLNNLNKYKLDPTKYAVEFNTKYKETQK